MRFSGTDDQGQIAPIFDIESDINPSKTDLGRFFVDLRFGYMLNFPIKGRNFGVGFSITAFGYTPITSDITYFGKDNQLVESSVGVQHVLFALDFKSDLALKR